MPWNNTLGRIAITSAEPQGGKAPHLRWCSVVPSVLSPPLPHDCGPSQPGISSPRTLKPGTLSVTRSPPAATSGYVAVAFAVIHPPTLQDSRPTYSS
jgi:hypothetical protein